MMFQLNSEEARKRRVSSQLYSVFIDGAYSDHHNMKMILYYCLASIIFWRRIHASVSPNVYWSMDIIQGNIIVPDIGDPQIFYLNVTEDNTDSEGISGNALRLQQSAVRVHGYESSSSAIEEGICFVDPTMCQDGLSLGMWIDVLHFAPNYCLFSTSERCGHTSSGVSVWKESDDLIASVFLKNGNYYQTAISSRRLIRNQWLHFGLTWNLKTGIKIYVNGTEEDDHTNTNIPNAAQNTDANDVFLTDDVTENPLQIMFGLAESPMVVLLDDVKLWYFPISAEDMFFASVPKEYEVLTNTTESSPNEEFVTSNQITSSTFPIISKQPTTVDELNQNESEQTSPGAITAAATSAVAAIPNVSPGAWRWILTGFCVLLFVLIMFMVLLLWKRRRSHRNEHRFQAIEMTSVPTSTSYASP